jgi:hypothetical protein
MELLSGSMEFELLNRQSWRTFAELSTAMHGPHLISAVH